MKGISIKRADLIKKCEEFIAGKIEKHEIEQFASDLIIKDFFEWNDETIADIISEWDNEETNYLINKENMKLWEHRLKTGENLLPEYNSWHYHIRKQKEICEKYQSEWNPINKKLIVGCSDNLSSDPIHGLRHPLEGNTSGWYIWAGEYSEANDYFKPICAEHLLRIRPQIIKYLGLDVGFRFLVDRNGYEDVWYDENLKK